VRRSAGICVAVAVAAVGLLSTPVGAAPAALRLAPYTVKDVRRSLAAEGIGVTRLERIDRSAFARSTGCPFFGWAEPALAQVVVCETSARASVLMQGTSSFVLLGTPHRRLPVLHKANVVVIVTTAGARDQRRLERALARLRR
jgi:hypothetical protein